MGDDWNVANEESTFPMKQAATMLYLEELYAA